MTMKKYLIRGTLALVLGGLLASCQKDEDLQGSLVADKIVTFEKVFKEEFGEIDPNHTWGFGQFRVNLNTGAKTRSVDVNGNMWETRPEVTAAEAQAVYDWVNRLKSDIPTASYYETSPINWKNFFVTQVWGGQSDDPNCNYTAKNNGAVFGPEHMDHLQISISSERLDPNGLAVTDQGTGAINSNWDHANNFNASQNRDWDGNTMFVNWGTQNFAYHNSEDSRYHDRWIIVDGAYITDSEGVNHAGKYYVCFDFIAQANVKTIIGLKVPGNNPGEMVDKGGVYTIDGYYSDINDVPSVTFSVPQWDGSSITYTINEGTGYEWYIKDYDGNTNMAVDPNNYYTDWIVRLVEAKRKSSSDPETITIPIETPEQQTGQTPVYKTTTVYEKDTLIEHGRVFCEDLGTMSKNDIDYNDAVFDAYIYAKLDSTVITYAPKDGAIIEDSTKIVISEPKSYYAKVWLLAAGGTVELKLAGKYEVHNMFGTSLGTLVNTANADSTAHNNPYIPYHAPVEIGPIDNIESIEGISIDVKFSREFLKLEAKQGGAAHKFVAPIKTKWTLERKKFKETYLKFVDYVQASSVKFWEAEGNEKEDEIFDTSKMYGDLEYNYPKSSYVKQSSKETDLDTPAFYIEGETTTSGGYKEGDEVLIRVRN